MNDKEKLEELKRLSDLLLRWGYTKDKDERDVMAGARAAYIVSGQEICRVLNGERSFIVVEDEE